MFYLETTELIGDTNLEAVEDGFQIFAHNGDKSIEIAYAPIGRGLNT